MTFPALRLSASVLAVGVLGAVVVALPTAAEASTGSGFRRVVAADIPSRGGTLDAGASVARAPADLAVAAKTSTVKTSKQDQVLQVSPGANGSSAGAIPDLSVAAGPKHVVQLSDAGATIVVKASGKSLPKLTLADFFGMGGGSVTLSQPQIAYDPVGKRWVAVARTDDAGDVGLAVRVSKGTSPLSWYKAVGYADSSGTDPNPNVVESLPRLGVSSDKVAVTMAASDPDPGGSWIKNRVLIVPKPGLYGGKRPDAWIADVNSTYDGQFPVVNASKDPNIYTAIPNAVDFTVGTYSGAATDTKPQFTKSVMYPAGTTTPPLVDQGSGDDLDLGATAVQSATMRSGRLWAAMTVACPTSGSCIQVVGVAIKGMSLVADDLLARSGASLVGPAVSVDGSGNPHVVVSVVKPDSKGPSVAVAVSRNAAASSPAWKWTTVRKGEAAFDDDGTPGVADWSAYSGAAAVDPASPWDVWVTGAWGASSAAPNWSSTIARASVGIGHASVTASKKSVSKGAKVTFSGTLQRPDSKSAVARLPVVLQFRPKSGGSWSVISRGSVDAKGAVSWTVKVKRTGQWRLVGKAVKQSSLGGPLVAKAVGKPVTVTVG